LTDFYVNIYFLHIVFCVTVCLSVFFYTAFDTGLSDRHKFVYSLISIVQIAGGLFASHSFTRTGF